MIQPGWIYFAPPNYHLLVEPHGYFALNSDEPVHYSRPSIDVTFESIAFSYEERAAGIILSGANEDGAWGLKQIAQRGGSTAVQTPESAIAPVMPQAAIEQVPGSRVLSVDAIYPYLVELSLRN
jgi:two-component system chemotaxis response regulator CheB